MTLRDKVAALKAERDLLRAQLAKRRYPKKPYEEMTTAEGLAMVEIARGLRVPSCPVARGP